MHAHIMQDAVEGNPQLSYLRRRFCFILMIRGAVDVHLCVFEAKLMPLRTEETCACVDLNTCTAMNHNFNAKMQIRAAVGSRGRIITLLRTEVRVTARAIGQKLGLYEQNHPMVFG